jgi:hypothetical protein
MTNDKKSPNPDEEDTGLSREEIEELLKAVTYFEKTGHHDPNSNWQPMDFDDDDLDSDPSESAVTEKKH